jgi:hypothetical protein
MIQAMKSRVRFTMLLLLLILSVLAVFMAWRRWRDRSTWMRVTVAQVESEIGHNISVGSSRTQVDSYLDQKKIPHSFYGDANYKGTEYYNSEVALVPKTASSEFVTTDIQIIFRFDPNMKLVSHEVHEVYTGP